MVSDSVGIANIALSKIGGKQITALSDNTAINNCYDMILDEVLCEHPWTWAQTRALGVTATAPTIFTEDGLTILYNKPTTMLKLNYTNSSTAEIRIEQNGILSNEEDLSFLYTSRITDVTKYSQAFIQALSTRLAAEVAFAVTNDMKKAEALIKEYEGYRLPHAMAADSQQGSSDAVTQDEWENARNCGAGWASSRKGADTWVPFM